MSFSWNCWLALSTRRICQTWLQSRRIRWPTIKYLWSTHTFPRKMTPRRKNRAKEAKMMRKAIRSWASKNRLPSSLGLSSTTRHPYVRITTKFLTTKKGCTSTLWSPGTTKDFWLAGARPGRSSDTQTAIHANHQSLSTGLPSQG